VLAQDSGAQAKIDDAKTLDTIVVTAQKREEALQDVPIVVTVLSQQALQDSGVKDIKDLQMMVPGLTVTSTQNEAITTARIRGIGTVGDNIGLESSVGVVIDGVYRPRNSVGFGDLGELERIEVLKGPQGTLFGKNTSAGVINVVTRNPDFGNSGEAELTIGAYGEVGGSGWFNTPLGEKAALRVSAAARKRDGWMDVVNGVGPRNDHDDYDRGYGTVRAKLLLQPNDNVEVVFSADFTKRDEKCCTAVQLFSSPTFSTVINGVGGGNAIAPPGSADPFSRRAYSNRGTEQKIEDKGISAEVNWNLDALGGATLTSITALRNWSAINGRDFDFSGADLLWQEAKEDESFNGFKTTSQEFRLAGATEKVDWLVGLFYTNEDLDRTESYNIGAAYEPYLSTLVGGQALPQIKAALDPTLAALSTQFGLPLKLSINPANPAAFLSQFSGRPFGATFTGLGALDKYEQKAKSLALFTNNTWHATEALDLTLGVRYTREKKTLDSVYDNPNGGLACAASLANPGAGIARLLAARITGLSQLPAANQQALISQLAAGLGGSPAGQALVGGVLGRLCLPWTNALHDGRVTKQSRTEQEWSGTLKGAYRWNEHVMTYLSGARGYKAGGFNLDRVQSSNGLSSGGPGILPVNDTSFPGEFVDSYELGTKTTWAGGSLLLNATLFHQTYSDFQLNSFLGTSFVVRAIPEVVSRGIDAEILWKSASLKGLMLQGGFTYANTEYGDERPTPEFALGTLPSGADYGALYKLPGSQVSFAPKLSASSSLTYEWDFAQGIIGRFNIGAKYMSEFNTGSDLDVEKVQGAYTVTNMRVGLESSDRAWAIELWGQNVFDTEYVQVGFDGPLQAGGSSLPNAQHLPTDPLNTYNAFLGPPRTYGVTFRKRF
ncbi:MAG: TonB-dependent receptor, partial [Thermomonas sp.]